MLQRDFKIARHLMNLICIIVYIKSVWHFTIFVYIFKGYTMTTTRRDAANYIKQIFGILSKGKHSRSFDYNNVLVNLAHSFRSIYNSQSTSGSGAAYRKYNRIPPIRSRI